MADPTGTNLTVDQVEELDRSNGLFGRFRIFERVRQLRAEMDTLVAGVTKASILAVFAALDEALDLNGQNVDDVGNIDSAGTVKADTIGEHTPAAGVTVDGVLLKDSTVKTDTLIEKTPGAGVTADGVQCKDSTVYATNTPLLKLAMAEDADAAGDDGFDAEKVLATLTLTAASVGTARRKVRVKGYVGALGFNAVDTWRVRVRVGGLLGEVIVDSGALANAGVGEAIYFEADAQITDVGAGGKFNSYGLTVPDGATPISTFNVAGAIDTTGTVDVVVTALASSNNAGNTLTLTDFTAEVMPA
jgi:hypothetical protein